MDDEQTLTVAIDSSDKTSKTNASIDLQDTQGFPIEIDERFKFLQILGQGGFGKIYLAFDNKLQRQVAIKFLHSASANSPSMLIQEACAQAQIKHQNICQIHEVFELQGQVYLVMQYIEGDALNHLNQTLNLEQILLIIKDILRGLHESHRLGIIHRDIKPSNILIETSSRGKLKPYLIDFGLAYRGNVLQQTSEYSDLGTPSYMAPEQISGDPRIDRRVDIYSIGATLYRLLTGTHLKNSSLGGEQQHSGQEHTQKLNESKIPLEIQSLILKCIQHDPNNRYSSANALADDIERYIDGEPIQSHQEFGYRFKKKLTKHKWLASLGFIVLLTLSTSIGWTIYNDYRQHVREQLIQRFTEKVEKMESQVRLTYMTPRHDISEELSTWKKSIVELKNEIQSTEHDDLVIGPGNYAIGRMLLSLQEYERALPHLEKAWNSGYDQTRVAYYLALNHGALFQQKKTIIDNLKNKSKHKDEIALLDQKHRLPAIKFMELGFNESNLKSYAQALLFYYQNEFDSALKILNDAKNFPTWFYEDDILMGDIYMGLAESAKFKQADDQMQKHSKLALENYHHASEIAPSDFNLQLKPLSIHLPRLTSFLYAKKGDFDNIYQQAKQALKLAKQVNATDHRTRYYLGQLLIQKAEYESQNGNNPLSSLELAIEEFNEAKKLNPDVHANAWALGLAYVKKISLLQSKQHSIDADLKKATNVFEQIPIKDRDYYFYDSYGSLLRLQATNIIKNSIERSNAIFAQSVEAFQMATNLKPKRIIAFINGGSAYRVWSESVFPLDAKKKLELAIKHYLNATSLNPDHFIANFYLGSCYRRLAQIQNSLLEDKYSSLDEAIKHLDRALILAPENDYVINEIAMLETDQAVYLWQEGSPYIEKFQSAISRLDKSLEKNNKNALLLATRAATYMTWYELNYLSDNLNTEFVITVKIAIDDALEQSKYNQIDKLIFSVLENQKIDKIILSSLDSNDDRVNLLKALWNSRQNNYQSAEVHFAKIKQYYPSVLSKYRHRNFQIKSDGNHKSTSKFGENVSRKH